MQKALNFEKLITDVIPDLIFVKDKEYKIVACNPAFLSVYPDHMQDKIIGYTTLEEYSPEEAAIFLEHDKLAFQDGQSETEETIRFPDGRTRTLFTKKVRFKGEDGNSYILGIARDITDFKEINEELEEFAYRTSHDLRSPIISSLGLLEVAKTAIKDNNLEKAESVLDLISGSLDKLHVLVQDILSLTEIRNKQLEILNINVQELVADALEKLTALPSTAGIEIQTDFNHKGDIIAAVSRFRLIVENLISNALKYSNKDQSRSFVRIKTYEEGKDFFLEVEDNGLGIPEDRREEMFEMFRRFHPKESYGSGLGLYMIKKSADILNGKISYTPKDEGTIFTLKIPKIPSDKN